MSASPFELEFYGHSRPRWRWLGWGMLVVAVLAGLALSEQLAEASQRHTAAESRHAQLNERLRAKTPRRTVLAPDPQTLADVQRANIIIDQLTVPWDELFDAVEAADARGLAVLSLTPNARDRSLRLAGESRSMADLLAYVGRVAEQPVLSQVHLQGYNTVVREGMPVVAFTLAATWRQQQP
ncbi:MAG: hypothetical protein H7Y33_16290 [Cytophagales bacterium]|nr:hypothetical protein [Rhizobacter sp.]